MDVREDIESVRGSRVSTATEATGFNSPSECKSSRYKESVSPLVTKSYSQSIQQMRTAHSPRAVLRRGSACYNDDQWSGAGRPFTTGNNSP